MGRVYNSHGKGKSNVFIFYAYYKKSVENFFEEASAVLTDYLLIIVLLVVQIDKICLLSFGVLLVGIDDTRIIFPKIFLCRGSWENIFGSFFLCTIVDIWWEIMKTMKHISFLGGSSR